MPSSAASIDPARLRRYALKQQGLRNRDAFGRGRGAVLRAIEQLGYVQIDTISVVARAHHHVLHSRVGNYDGAMLDRLLADRQIFEYWFHAAAYLPLRDYRFALPRMAQVAAGQSPWHGRRDGRLQRQILARIEAEGPLASSDFEGSGKGGGWWDWKPAKRELEFLFMRGDLMVCERVGFQKRYELRERFLPAGIDTRMPTAQEYAEHLLDHSLRNFGYATVPDTTHLRRSAPLRGALQALLEERVSEGRLIVAVLPQVGRACVDSSVLETRQPTAASGARILSPFDPLVIQRRRTRTLFDFDYQIECYVPAAKRRYGYFCLPLLYRDRLIGRLDCKAHRQQGRFEVRSAHFEPGIDPRAPALRSALNDALQHTARFNGCRQVCWN